MVEQAARGPIPIEQIRGRILKGIRKAQSDYGVWADGAWLSEAPEYFMTTYIAREIAAVPAASWSLALEADVRETMKQSGQGRRRRRALRPDGRFDMLLSWGNRKPRAVIEVKQNVRGFWAVRADLARVTAALGSKENSLQCGILAFFMAMPDGVRKAARDRVWTRYESLVAKSKQFAGSQGLRLDARNGGVSVDDGAALAVTLVVK
ncbi:MAG: hypothetical protein OXU77_04560 [Gammaproteobacteria bacterium]|nr:hypothetical protein [Gammaproteobacteria bacterium]MDE0443767.1 hypothetical protein [Gammaproteobacteria bacterium]